MGELTNWKVQTKYYKYRHRILAGVPEFKRLSGGHWVNERLKIVEVFGGIGREELIERNNRVRRALRAKGYAYEDCFITSGGEGGRGWWLKGLVRFERGVENGKAKKLLVEAWSGGDVSVVRLIDYKVVGFKVVGDLKNEVTRYIRNSMLVVVLNGEYWGKRLVKSEGWRLSSGAVSGPGWFHITGRGKVVSR